MPENVDATADEDGASKRPSAAERKALKKAYLRDNPPDRSRKGSKDTVGNWLAKRLLAIVGLLFLGYTAFVWGLDRWAQGWPTTRGVVLDSGIRTEEAWFQGKHRSSPRMVHVPWIRYQYEWKGKILESDRQYVSDLFLSRDFLHDAKSEVNRFPKGKEITVRVCPLRSSTTVIKRYAFTGLLFPLVSGIMALVLAVVIHVSVRG